jgi:hypothetical protein
VTPAARYAEALARLEHVASGLGPLLARARRAHAAGFPAGLETCDAAAAAVDRAGLEICTLAADLGEACDAESDRLEAGATCRRETRS